MSHPLFGSLRPPKAPPELRREVLRACRGAESESKNLLDRLWRSQAARWAWAGTVLILLAANLSASGRGLTPQPLSQPSTEAIGLGEWTDPTDRLILRLIRRHQTSARGTAGIASIPSTVSTPQNGAERAGETWE